VTGLQWLLSFGVKRRRGSNGHTAVVATEARDPTAQHAAGAGLGAAGAFVYAVLRMRLWPCLSWHVRSAHLGRLWVCSR
jgi:hypothetical protein